MVEDLLEERAALWTRIRLLETEIAELTKELQFTTERLNYWRTVNILDEIANWRHKDA